MLRKSELVVKKDREPWTSKDRKTRIKLMIEKIKEKKQLTKIELYRYCLNEFGLSLRVLDDYFNILIIQGLIKVEHRDNWTGSDLSSLTVHANDLVIWIGEKNNNNGHT